VRRPRRHADQRPRGALGGVPHTRTHQAIAIAVYDALPRAAQSFLQLSDVELRFWARVPDELDGDNIRNTGSDGEHEQYAHTYKLERDGETFRHLVGSAPSVIASLPRDVRNAVREGQFDEARRIFAKGLHYTVDLTTIWHLTREIPSDRHSAGEKEIAQKLAALMPRDPKALPLPDPKSLYRSCIQVAQETLLLFLDRAKAAQAEGRVTSDMELCAQMLERCSGFSLAVAQYVWRYVEAA